MRKGKVEVQVSSNLVKEEPYYNHHSRNHLEAGYKLAVDHSHSWDDLPMGRSGQCRIDREEQR